MTKKQYMTTVHSDANELIECGRAIANAGYFMKRVLRETVLAEKVIQKHNNELFKKMRKEQTIESLETELERLQKLLEEKQNGKMV